MYLFGLFCAPVDNVRLLTCEVGIIDGYVPAPVIIQDLELGAIRNSNVGKIFLIVGIHVFGVCFPVLVPQVVPFRCSQGDLQLFHLLRRNQIFEVKPIMEIRGSLVLDFAGAYDGLARLMTGFG